MAARHACCSGLWTRAQRRPFDVTHKGALRGATADQKARAHVLLRTCALLRITEVNPNQAFIHRTAATNQLLRIAFYILKAASQVSLKDSAMADSGVDRDASAEASGGGFPYLGLLWALSPYLCIVVATVLWGSGAGEACENPGTDNVAAVLFIIATVILVSRAITERATREISNKGFALIMFLAVISIAMSGFIFYSNVAWC